MRAPRRVSPLAGTVAILVMLAGPTLAGSIEGRILNGSEPDGVLAGHPVRLTGSSDAGQRVDLADTTDATGAFAFTDLAPDTAMVFAVSTEHGGVEYVSDLLRFGPFFHELETELVVYDTTDDLGGVHLLGHHFIIEAIPGAPSTVVTEVMAISNPGRRAVHGGEVLTFPLPEGARSVEGFDGFEGVHAAHGEVHLDRPLPPGTTEGAFRYLLPADDPVTVTGTMVLPTSEITVLVAPVGAEVEGAGLQPLGEIDLGTIRCDRYSVPIPAHVGGSFRVTVSVPQPLMGAPYVITGAFLVAFITLVLTRGRLGMPVAGPGPEARRLAAERDRHLQEIVALEARRDAGQLDPDAFDAQRETHWVKAVALEELLEEMSARGPA